MLWHMTCIIINYAINTSKLLQMKTIQKRGNRVITTIIFVMAITVFASTSLHAATHESLKNIRYTVSQFLNAHFADSNDIKFSIGRLDKRLRLTKCTQKLETFIPDAGRMLGYTTIGLRCSQPQREVERRVHARGE